MTARARSRSPDPKGDGAGFWSRRLCIQRAAHLRRRGRRPRPFPEPLIRKVAEAIKSGDTGPKVQKDQQTIVAMLNDIIRQVLSIVLARSSMPDEMHDVAGGDVPETALNVTRPCPDPTHLFPSLKGKMKDGLLRGGDLDIADHADWAGACVIRRTAAKP